jgi:hypothetical protein
LAAPGELDMRYNNQSFFGDTVMLCGNEYLGCTFSKCKLVFSGEEALNMRDCLIREPEWIFTGPAGNTMKFLAASYHGMGDDGVRFVESIFNNIRLNRMIEHDKQ